MNSITSVFNLAQNDSVMTTQTSESFTGSGVSRRRILVGAGGALVASVLLGAVAPPAAHAARVALPAEGGPAVSGWEAFATGGRYELHGGTLSISAPWWVPGVDRIGMQLAYRSTSASTLQLSWQDNTNGSVVSKTLKPGEVWRHNTNFTALGGYDAVKTLRVIQGGKEPVNPACEVILAPWLAQRAMLPSGGDATITDATACGADLETVRWALSTMVTPGTAQAVDVTTFFPDLPLMRDEAVSYLYNLAGMPYVETRVGSRYQDVDWRNPYKRAIIWATQSGISTGWVAADGTRSFRPSQMLSREIMAVFLFRYAKTFPAAPGMTTKRRRFSDVKANSPYADAIGWLGAVGLATGPTFRPKDALTRREAVRFIQGLSTV